MSRVLITGGAGFIGSHIAEYFCSQPDAEVVVLDNLRSGRLSNLEPFRSQLRFIQGSVVDRQLVAQAMQGCDYVFHLAAMVSVPESLEKPFDCQELNVVGTLNVLEAARQHQVKKVVLSSSAAIYGDDPGLPKVESMRPAPKTPYSITKLDGEYYLQMYSEQWGLPTASLRYFNVFGPGQDPASQYAAAVPIFIQRALHGDTLTIHGDGGQTRDFIYVKDVVAANVLAAITPKMTGVFNVACGQATTILQLAQMILQLTQSSTRLVHAEERPGDVRHSQADTGKIQDFGFVPGFSLSQGLRLTIDSLG